MLNEDAEEVHAVPVICREAPLASSGVVVISTGDTHVHVAGTVALDAHGNLIGDGDMGAQVSAALAGLRRSLRAAGVYPEDVVRLTIYTVDVDAYLAEGAAQQAAFFGDTVPAMTLLGISRLADPRCLIAFQADARIHSR